MGTKSDVVDVVGVEVDTEDEDTIYKKNMEALTKLLKDVPDLYPCLETDFLFRFLRLHSYDPEETKKQVVEYYRMRADYPDVFENVAIEKIKDVFDVGVMSFWPDIDQDGCLLFLFDMEKWDTSKHALDEIYASILAACDWAASTPESQLNGIKMIANATGLTWTHLWQFRPRHFTLGIKIFEDYLPVQFKKIHVMNSNKMFDILFSWFKPMLSYCLQAKIVFNNAEYDQVLENVDPDLVPVMYGGNNPGPFDGNEFIKMFSQAEKTMTHYNSFGFNKK